MEIERSSLKESNYVFILISNSYLQPLWRLFVLTISYSGS